MERKLATVLFVDLVGSTELVAARDPEVVRRRVNSYFEHVSHCITTHGGIVEKFAGDAVMAAFGIPQAHEDDAERAVRAAAAILDSVHELGLEARIGVEAGEVVADESDSTFATGEAVNVAARLQQAAQPGEIMVGPFARRLTVERRRDRRGRPDRGKGLRRAAARVAPGRDPRQRRPGAVGRRAVRRPRLRARAAREHARPRDPAQARAPVHDLRRARGGEEPARTRVPRGRRRGEHPRRPLASLRRGRHLLAARRDGQGRGRDRRRRPGPGGDLEAARPVRRRRGRRPARARRRRARGNRDRAQPAGDRLGGARVGRRARRREAADPRLRGRPLGRGAAARADRAPGRARQGRAADDSLPRPSGAARHPSELGRRPPPRRRDRARAACARGERGAARRAARRPRAGDRRSGRRCSRRPRETRSTSRRRRGCCSRAAPRRSGSPTRSRR